MSTSSITTAPASPPMDRATPKPEPSKTGEYCDILHGQSCQACTAFHELKCNPPQAHDIDFSTKMGRFLQHLQVLRCKINDKHDRVAKLPHKWMREIFHYIALAPGTTAADVLAIASVCKSWRKVMLEDPTVWATVHIPFISDGRFGLNEMWLWLSRAQRKPLSLVIEGMPPNAQWVVGGSAAFHRRSRDRDAAAKAMAGIYRMLHAANDRIHSIDAFGSTWFFQEMVKIPLTPGYARVWQKLKRISITRVNNTLKEIIEILRHCQCVEDFEHTQIENEGADGEPEAGARSVYLPHLTTLSLGLIGPDCRLRNIFARLRTPYLTEMTYRYTDAAGPESSSALEELFSRCGCSITTLRIEYSIFEGNSLVSLLRSQPSLRHFSTQLLPCRIQTEIEIQTSLAGFRAVLQELKKDRRQFLPNLEVLEHSGGMLYPWNDLVSLWMGYNELSEHIVLPANARRPLRLMRFLIGNCVPHGNENNWSGGPAVYDTMVFFNPMRWKHLDLLTGYASEVEANGVCRFECDCDIRLLRARH